MKKLMPFMSVLIIFSCSAVKNVKRELRDYQVMEVQVLNKYDISQRKPVEQWWYHAWSLDSLYMLSIQSWPNIAVKGDTITVAFHRTFLFQWDADIIKTNKKEYIPLFIR